MDEARDGDEVRNVVGALHDAGALRPGLNAKDAATLIDALVTVDAVDTLVTRKRWSVSRTGAELLRAVRAAILR